MAYSYYMQINIGEDRTGSLNASPVSDVHVRRLEKEYGTADAFAQDGMQLHYDVMDQLSKGAQRDIGKGYDVVARVPIDWYYNWVAYHNEPLPLRNNGKGKRRNGRQYNYDEVIDFLTDDNSTPELERRWDVWTTKVSDAYHKWSGASDDVDYDELAWNSFGSATGMGIGLWEGDMLGSAHDEAFEKVLKANSDLMSYASRLDDDISLAREPRQNGKGKRRNVRKPGVHDREDLLALVLHDFADDLENDYGAGSREYKLIAPLLEEATALDYTITPSPRSVGMFRVASERDKGLARNEYVYTIYPYIPAPTKGAMMLNNYGFVAHVLAEWDGEAWTPVQVMTSADLTR